MNRFRDIWAQVHTSKGHVLGNTCSLKEREVCYVCFGDCEVLYIIWDGVCWKCMCCLLCGIITSPVRKSSIKRTGNSWGRVVQSSTYSQPSVNAPSALFSWPIQTCPTAPSAAFSWKLVPLPQLPLLQASCVLWVSNLPSLNLLAWHVINKSGG